MQKLINWTRCLITVQGTLSKAIFT